MTRAEEQALKVYSPKMEYSFMIGVALGEKKDANERLREAFIKGYEQAGICDKKSPITGGDMELRQEMSTVKFRGEDVEFTKKYYHCVESGQEFTDTELDNDNMWAIFRAYWERRGFEHFYDIDGYRKEEKSALNRADIIHSEQYKVSRASVDWYQTHQDADCLDGFEAGAQWQKEQMMKGAIEGRLDSTVTGSEQYVSAYVGYGEYGKDGDKVKVIIIKE